MIISAVCQMRLVPVSQCVPVAILFGEGPSAGSALN